MKQVTLHQFLENPTAFLNQSQCERILLTCDGHPFVLISGVEYKDQEDWELENSPEFWRMIEEQRRLPTIPLDQVRDELLREDSEMTTETPAPQ